MIISSNSNKLIKDVKSLSKKKNRDKLGLFIVEGINMVEEVIDREYEFTHILYSNKLLKIQGGRELFEKIRELKNVLEVEEYIFDSLSDTLTPQGVLAICKKTFYNLDDISIKEDSYIFLDGLQDPGNMGTIIRSADAFNISGIILNRSTVDPYNPKVIRATMGSIFRLPIYYIENLEEDMKNLKNKGYKLLSTSLESSNNIRGVDFKNSIVAIGNESSGVSEEIYALSDEKIKIEMPGSSESLNAGVAASIIMYETSK